MLNHSFEFIRIADPKPDSEKVTKRRDSAAELSAILSSKQNRELTLGCVQGSIIGFTSSSPASEAVLKAIQERDAAFPTDLVENRLELQACAALAIGELLTTLADKSESLTAALALRAGLESRPPAKEKHLKSAHGRLAAVADGLISAAATNRRQRSTTALRRLEKLEEPATPEVWKTLMSSFRATFRELYAQAAADREEIDSLWWMFQGFSDVAKKPISGLPAPVTALCAGVELADRALVPPMPSGVQIVCRAVELGKKSQELEPISLQDLVTRWDEHSCAALSPAVGPQAELSHQYPVLLPLSYACRLWRDAAFTGKLPKQFSAASALSVSHARRPSEWATQVFHERILQRVITESQGS